MTATWPTSTPRPAERLTTVSVLTDFGLADEFVGILHAVIARGAPEARIVDLTHLIEPHDVRAGALTLWRSAPWLAPGVVLAVVDPGVGTDRRAVAVEVAEAATILVGPDNGLLLPAIARLGGPTAAVKLPPNPEAAGATFAGRDVFAPAAARAAAGEPLAALGAPIDPAGLRGGTVPAPVASGDGTLACEILWVDRFGNAQVNATPSDLGRSVGDTVEVVLGGHTRPMQIVGSYGNLSAGEVGLVVDSYGLLALSFDRGSAAARLGLRAGDAVRLCRHDQRSR